MIVRRNYLFYPQKEDGKLRFRITWNGFRVSFYLGFRIEKEKWVSEAQRAKNNTFHGKKKIPAFEINRKIEKYIATADDAFRIYEQKNLIPTAEQFRDEFNSLLGKKKKTGEDIPGIVDEFIYTQSVANSWTETTCRRFRTTFRKLLDFRNVKINEIDDEFLQEYIEHQEERGYKNTTTTKELKLIYWFLRWASRNNFYNGRSFETFRPRLKTTQKEVIYLTWDELQKIYHFDFGSRTSLNKVRDLLCFCCFSGLRYSDMAKLRKSDIYDGAIHVVTKKTTDNLTIELNKYTTEILSRYADTDSELALPVISNVKMNEYLKELGKVAEINEPIRQVYFIGSERKEEVHPKYELLTTHAGRRTFVVNAIFLGIAPEVIMKWTGHSNYESMKPYIAIVDKLKRQEMNKFNI